jgi:hypothetical protein
VLAQARFRLIPELENTLDARPLDISIDWVGEHLFEGFSVGSIHALMIAFLEHYAII